MPAVYRPKNENVYRCKVGYHHNAQGQRKRREFRLSDDPVIAHKLAINLEEKWMKEEARHWKMQVVDREGLHESDDTLPVWTGRSEIEQAGYNDYIATPPDVCPGDDDAQVPPEILTPTKTLAGCAADVLAKLKEKMERDQRSPRTYGWYEVAAQSRPPPALAALEGHERQGRQRRQRIWASAQKDGTLAAVPADSEIRRNGSGINWLARGPRTLSRRTPKRIIEGLRDSRLHEQAHTFPKDVGGTAEKARRFIL